MQAVNQNKERKGFILRLFGTLVAFGVVIFLVWQNWSGFIDAIRSLPLGLLLIVLLLAFTSRIMISFRWFFILRVVVPEVTFWKVLKLSFLGLFATNVLPSTIGGDVVKLGGAVQSGLDTANVTASLVIDRLMGMATMATFLPFGIVNMVQANTSSLVLASAVPQTSIGKYWQKLGRFLKRTGLSLKLWFKQPQNLLLAALFSYIHMFCTFTMVLLILSGLGDPISWWTAGGLWVLVYFITLIPVSINGLGLQEASLSLIYASFAGVSESNSLVLALLMRVLFMIASLPGAFFLPGTFSGNQKGKDFNRVLPQKDG